MPGPHRRGGGCGRRAPRPPGAPGRGCPGKEPARRTRVSSRSTGWPRASRVAAGSSLHARWSVVGCATHRGLGYGNAIRCPRPRQGREECQKHFFQVPRIAQPIALNPIHGMAAAGLVAAQSGQPGDRVLAAAGARRVSAAVNPRRAVEVARSEQPRSHVSRTVPRPCAGWSSGGGRGPPRLPL